ncbi:cysteine--1-D-myo-inosityl 2-amino-2-deoxy-alpha-D-glucopyranoside ligase [Enteractinococcus coprophilus]|uniref:L-cysteine:1D-myo-inositol 2-amino-2-deoxy-alpha-D-glucopyranoside ligase n=1 Tax=Enteractinococcus coprophilus TaxID=1027633 RepID=A0A543AJC0_9MICC|nr:cysteine--1-D-myo-inosityl 2-amino-2-deoxy-alpha-D-glucopyranoside ligase [Enteractinococcus coprophilus]TQL72672.1 L-cysteine:1D-myo-inositol 2-amino-2-deoxy-alpha-D-glucopyranoside ligase [Enteractinococcus coprophilus]
MKSWITPFPVALPAQQDNLHLFDTVTQEKQRVTVTDDHATMYVCGITPYDATHLGHANTYVAFDLLYRYWLAAGHRVTYTQNVTDVDDPLFERANEMGIDYRELSEDQTNLFRSDMQHLNVLSPSHYLSVSETVDWVRTMVREMLDAGVAYTVPGDAKNPDGDIYFSIEAAEDHTDWRLGSVGTHSLEEMIEFFPERGGDPQRAGKRNPLDPLVWSARREGEPYWHDDVLGDGRPGWHVECSAIAYHTLPAPFTVQGGGSDLRFPHHEFSAAHTTAVTHQPMAEYFVHSGMVGLDGVKMSKSLGNLELVSNLVSRVESPMAIRALLLSNHYRSDWSYSHEKLGEATKRFQTWRSALACEQAGDAETVLKDIFAALSDDLDAPRALDAVDQWAQESIARGIPRASDLPSITIAVVLDALLGIKLY